MSTSYFVAADWLIEHGDDPEVQIIDARMAPPGQEHRDVPGEYRAGHLPGAVFLISKPSPITPPLCRTCCHARKPSPWRCASWASAKTNTSLFMMKVTSSLPRARGGC